MTEFININNQEINDKFPLENFLNSNTRVIIDTCSILEDNSEKFFKYAIPILQKNKSFLLIPKSCILEIEKHHSHRYETLAKELKAESLFIKEEQTQWICRKCGHIQISKCAPNKCPVCQHPQGYFEIFTEKF